VTGARATRMPRGLRDTRTWYGDTDPMSQVDPGLVAAVAPRAGHRVLDLGCGLGGYSRALGDRGFDCYGLDVVEQYVEAARGLGVRADHYDGGTLPLDDDAVDTVVMIEVLEHLEEPGAILREAARVAARNVLVTTPNCTQSFDIAPIEFSHMLDVDHRQFFTAASLGELLAASFERCEVNQIQPVDEMIARLVLPGPLRRVHRGLGRLGVVRPRYFYRLLGEGWPAAGAPR
jgi:2-polyprenyl-3-methyl-5-hydroxy-6-metoxy-1,4-benzoquinol methylase